MIFDELKHNIKNFPKYEIVASDIDDHAVNIAKKGYYGNESLKEIPEKYFHKHFTEVDDQLGTKHVLSDSIKNQVEFLVEDITKGHKKNQKYDIIFCRYLLIYINRNFRENLLKILERKLAAGGLLILGKTETLINSNSPFKLIDGRNHFYAKI
jgi:chemotaxis methyl-accepting protein methylase